MPSKNKPATTTTEQTRSPWAPAQANLKTVLKNSAGLAADPTNWTPTYSGSTMSGIQGIEGVANNFAQNGSGAYGALSQVVPGSTEGFQSGLGQLQQTANGQYLNSNPYLDAALGAGREAVTNGVNGSFAGAGRYGSAAHTGALTKGLGQLESQARLANYQTERGSQDAAAKALYGGGFQGASMGGALDQSQLTPAQLQLQAGALRDAQAEAARTAPMRSTEWLAGLSNPIAGQGGTSSGTQTTVQPNNPFTQILGGAQMGLGLLTAPMTGGASLMGTAAAPSLLGSLTKWF